MAAAQRIVVPYSPRRVFLPFHLRRERFAIGVAHRRAGKTVACINDLVKKASLLQREYPPGRLGYVGPQLNQSKDNVWLYLKHYTAPLMRDKNESDLWVELFNGARIRLYGADNPDRIRGAYFDEVVLDEYADMAPSVWGEIVRPMLTDYQGGATFIGTPKGRNSFHDMFERAKGDPDWFTFMLRASETGILPPKELESARRDMTPEQYDQEFECSFDAAILGAYYGRDIAAVERAGRICEVEHDPALPVHTAWDLGKSDSTSIWLFQVAPDGIRVLDFFENHNQELDYYVAELNSRGEAHGYKWGTDWLPHDGRAAILGMKRTRVEQLLDMKRKPAIVPSATVADGINAARITLKRCWFDAVKCQYGLEALRQYRREFDEKTRSFRDTPKHDWTSHAADAFRYLSSAWRLPVVEEVKSTKPTELQYHVNEMGQLTSNMSVREIVELRMKRRKRDL